MILCYVLNLNRGDGRPGKLLVPIWSVLLLGRAPIFWRQRCGPRYAFGDTFPAGSPEVSPVLIKLSAWPNAIPSLHLSTALLFVLFAGRTRALRLVAWIYFLGTAAATLAFEHYFIDLIVAVPFGCFAVLTAERKISKALANLGLVLAWLLATRFATPALLVYPPVLRILAVPTAGFAAFSVMDGQKSIGRQLPQPATELPCPCFSMPELNGHLIRRGPDCIRQATAKDLGVYAWIYFGSDSTSCQWYLGDSR